MIAFFFLAFVSCNEENPTEPAKNYTGITRTSEASPDPIGEVDPDDWYYSTDTSDTVPSDSLGPVDVLPAKLSVYPAYPNPTTRYTRIRISLPQQDSVKVWINDPMSNKETVIVNRTLNAGVYEFQVDLNYGEDNFIRKPGIVRAFIDFINISDVPLIHGDIQIIE